MNRILFLILILLGFAFRGSGQNYIPYYNLVNEAEYAVYNRDYKKAVGHFEAAFKVEKPHAKDMYLLAYSLCELDSATNKKQVEKLLLQASEKSDMVLSYLRAKPLNLDLDAAFLDKLENLSEKWEKSTQTLNDKIAYFEERYSELRVIYRDSISLYYDDNEKESIAFRKQMARHDSIFQMEFLDYILANGYPGIYSSGSDIAGGFLQNINPSLYLQYEKAIFKELQSGHIQPGYYGLMVDEMGCYSTGKSFYGTTDLLSSCQPPLNEVKLNRMSIGMSPYFVGLRRFLSNREYRLLE